MGQYIAPSKQNTGRVSMAHQKITINVNVDNSNVELSEEQLEKIKTDVINEVRDSIDVSPETLEKIEQNATDIQEINSDITSLKAKDKAQDIEINKKADKNDVDDIIVNLNEATDMLLDLAEKVDNLDNGNISDEEIQEITQNIKNEVDSELNGIKENVETIKSELNTDIEGVREIAAAALSRKEFEENIKPYDSENTIGQAVKDIRQAVIDLEVGNVESIEENTINELD